MAENFEVHDFSDLKVVCQKIISLINSKTLILFYGGLGAGKTKTIELLLRELNVEGVSSPTFAIHHEYFLAPESQKSSTKSESRWPGVKKVDHFDLYRLETEDEIETSGLWDVLGNSSGIVIVEWAERLRRESLPSGWSILEIDIKLKNNNRLITLTQS